MKACVPVSIYANGAAADSPSASARAAYSCAGLRGGPFCTVLCLRRPAARSSVRKCLTPQADISI